MTQTKGDKRVNLHLMPSVHARLLVWCRRNGLTLQDGLATMVDLCAREVNGLHIPKLAEPAPQTLARPIVKTQAQSTPPKPIDPLLAHPMKPTQEELAGWVKKKHINEILSVEETFEDWLTDNREYKEMMARQNSGVDTDDEYDTLDS